MKLPIFIGYFLIAIFSIISCKSKPIIETKQEKTLLVQVDHDSIVPILETSFKAYGLRKHKVVSRPIKIFLFEYNEEKISEEALISELKASPHVIVAQKNRDVQLRNQNQ